MEPIVISYGYQWIEENGRLVKLRNVATGKEHPVPPDKAARFAVMSHIMVLYKMDLLIPDEGSIEGSRGSVVVDDSHGA